ncbi:hypothetical protein OG883_46410 [Streptomyces sp. NBC_01142]|uniref:hypothetical protein n=1 Tax=Streptomyces sp. NBC_01142 TaxID=2975865 RepID=UPI002259F5B4|nr:hypothetical protein [Streptomyces sp. NBC_01142]MCX4827075.1 hypothetical protein [Streptomyces sp. NBC_01142]
MLDKTATPEKRPLAGVAAALGVLDGWRAMSWADVAEAAGRIAHLLWDDWSRSGAFESLAAHDQAAVLHALAVGRRVHSEPRSRLGPDFWQSRVDEFRTEAAYSAALRGDLQGSTSLITDRSREAIEAVHQWQRLRALPSAWQDEVLERLSPDRRYSWRADTSPALPSLDEALRHAEAAVSNGTLPVPGDDRWLLAGVRGQDLVSRLSRLPEGWQTEAVRRMADGVTPLTSVSDAAQSINIVRVFGVYIAWNAASPSHTSRPAPRA